MRLTLLIGEKIPPGGIPSGYAGLYVVVARSTSGPTGDEGIYVLRGLKKNDVSI